MFLAGADLSYSWSQALADLGQIAPIVALVGFFLFAIVTDLILPAKRHVPLFARPIRIGPPCSIRLPWTRVFPHDKFLTFQKECD